jgi:uncharacterized protein YciI
MHYVIHCLDQARGPEIRKQHFDAHQTFLADTSRHNVKIVISGPLLSDDGVTPKGSFYLVEAPSRIAAEGFINADPYRVAGVWKQITIDGFLKRTDNR